MPQETIELQFPVAGVNRIMGYQSQPPYTTPSALNVRPFDAEEGRYRGGTRYGLVKAFSQRVGSGTPVYLMNTVRDIAPSSGSTWSDDFPGGAYSSAWSAASFQASGAPLGHGSGYLYAVAGGRHGLVRQAFSPIIDVAKAHTFTLDVKKLSTQVDPLSSAGSLNNSIELFLRMNDTTPNAYQDGVVIRLVPYVDGGYGFAIIALEYAAGVLVRQSSATEVRTIQYGDDPSTLTVVVNNDNTHPNGIVCRWNLGGGTVEVVLSLADVTAAGQRFGIGLNRPGTTGEPRLDGVSIGYTRSGGNLDYNKNRVVAAGGGDFYEEDNAGNLVVSDAGSISGPSEVYSSVERLGELFVASVTEGGIMSYKLSSDNYGSLAANGHTVAGTAPTLSRLCTVFRDRLGVGLQIHPSNPSLSTPHIWHLSRSGAMNDWDFVLEDVRASVSAVSSETASRLPAPLTMMGAYSDDYLIMATARQLFVLRNDPRLGGQLDLLSHEAGIISMHAWCRGTSNEMYFLAHSGLYVLRAGIEAYSGGIGVESLSSVRLPRELQNVNTVENVVTLVFDPTDIAVWIFITPLTAGGGTGHWYYDIRTQSFWPMALDPDHEPFTAITYYSDSPNKSGVLLGCRDGYIRRFNKDSSTDDGETITSYVDYGPIMLANDSGGRGGVRELRGILADTSGPVSWAVRSGNAPENAFAAANRSDCTGTWAAGRNNTVRPRTGGNAAMVRVSGTGRWSLESVALVRERLGRERK